MRLRDANVAGRVVRSRLVRWRPQRGRVLLAAAGIGGLIAVLGFEFGIPRGAAGPVAVQISTARLSAPQSAPASEERAVVRAGRQNAAAPTPTPMPALTSVAELTEQYGEPSDAALGRFLVPALGVDAPLGVRSVGSDGTMPNPSGPSDVVWYDFGAWAGYGGDIGAGANAVFAGHVDYADVVPWAGVAFSGGGVFLSLAQLSPGDIIEIETGGERLRYAVDWRRAVGATDAGAWVGILSSTVERDSITIVTCGGQFNTATSSYAERVVVRAVRL